LLVIYLKKLETVAKVAELLLPLNPESLESYDNQTFKVALKFFPEIVKQLKTNLLRLSWEFLPDLWSFITSGFPPLVVLAEFTGDSEQEVIAAVTKAQTNLAELPVTMRATHTAEEEHKYWVIRRESFNLLRHHMKHLRTAPFIDDVVVRPEQLPEFLPKLYGILNDYQLLYTVAGHVGNGNFHIIPLLDPTDPKIAATIQELSDRVFTLVLEFHGSLTAEHNDGIIRSPYLEQMYGHEVYELFRQTKQLFDPLNIFNPGKKIVIDQHFALMHLVKS
jgi:FAD/FMN-containing dehydrogenase